MRFRAPIGRIPAQIEADERLCRAHCRDQRGDAHDVDDAFEIVGQHVQGHFGADPFERLHLEVRRSHPRLDGSKRMLNGFTPLAHLLRVLVEPSLDGLEDVFVFPAGNPAFLARGAAILDGASLAGSGPVGQPRVGRRVYGKELFSVYLRFEGDSDRISSSRDQGLRGVYGKDMISVHG